MGMRCEISRSVLAEIVQRAEAAAPHEACGLLLGREGRIEAQRSAANVAAEPWHRFEIDPAVLIAAHRAARQGGPALLGYWHSHPGGRAMPSQTDAAMADPDGRFWLIVAGQDVTAWRAVYSGQVHGRFDAVVIAPI